MNRPRWLGFPVVCALMFAGPLAAETLTDSFDATEDPGGGNDYGLNSNLDVRQAGTLAPTTYSRIAGSANYVQVNNSTPDAHGSESGIGRLDFFALAFAAVQLDVVPAGHSTSLAITVWPVANYAPRDDDDWACICVGATGGNGFVNNPQAGVGMLIRDNGGVQVFNNGPLVAEGSVPVQDSYRVEISLSATGDRYSLVIDGQMIADNIEVATTGRLIQLGGYNGAAPPDQPFMMHLMDDLSLETQPAPVVACIETSATYGASPLTVDLDASCSVFQGTPASYEWDFGDGATGDGETASHTYATAGDYTITLVATDTDANSATATQSVEVYQGVTAYEEDFERADGPVDGWTQVVGDWTIASGRLHVGPTAAEVFAYAGDPAVSLPSYITLECDLEFLAPGNNAGVGRHGGILFGANRPIARNNGGFTGYFVDWIDRESDRGVRLSRSDNGAYVTLSAGSSESPDEPPARWKVEIEDEHIRVYGDDVLIIDVIDSRYRGGLIGAWAHSSAQELALDNLVVAGRPLTACFASAPDFPVHPASTISFDAGCAEAIGSDIVSWDWDFGDGSTGTGATTDHTYADPGIYTVTLTVEDGAGGTDDVTGEVTIHENLMPLADCFDRAAGPVDGWTPASGEWLISEEGTLTTVTSGTESFAWAGEPARPVGADFAIELDFEFLATPGDGVGRHGGLMFFASQDTDRYDPDINGYTLDWIDRASDHGFRLLRIDGGAQTVLQAGTPDIAEPPLRWGVRVEGDRIIVSADGVDVVDVEDATYRKGYVGVWVYSNGQSLSVDNVAAPPTEPAACSVDLACEVIDGDPPLLRVTAGAFIEGCQPAGCYCDEMEIVVDGVSAGTFPLVDGQVVQDLPLPDPCDPAGGERLVTARCVVDGTPSGDGAQCAFTCPEIPGGLQLPGDATQDGNLDISDAINLFGFLFLGSPTALPCGDTTAGDAANVALLDHNGDSNIDISDGVSVLNYLFTGGAPPFLGVECVRIPDCPDVCVAP